MGLQKSSIWKSKFQLSTQEMTRYAIYQLGQEKKSTFLTGAYSPRTQESLFLVSCKKGL